MRSGRSTNELVPHVLRSERWISLCLITEFQSKHDGNGNSSVSTRKVPILQMWGTFQARASNFLSLGNRLPSIHRGRTVVPARARLGARWGTAVCHRRLSFDAWDSFGPRTAQFLAAWARLMTDSDRPRSCRPSH